MAKVLSRLQDAMLYNGRIWTTAVSAMLIVLGGGALVLSLPGYRPRDLVARELARRLSNCPDEELLPHVRRMVALGEEGVSAAIRLLGSQRESEVEAAEVALLEELDRWRLLPAEESTPHVVHLAKTLCAEGGASSARRHRFSADVATQLLVWRVADPSQGAELLTFCETILRQYAGVKKKGAGESQSQAPEMVLEGPPLPSLARQSPPAG